MKILAIDIGTANIKTVIVEAKFKRFDVVLHDITSVPDAWDPILPGEQSLSPGQIATLAETANRYAGGVERVVTNLPFSLYSSRFITFPIKDKRKVQSAVKLAIEDEIPFDLEQCIVSSQFYPGKGKETHVLTGFAPIASLARFVDTLSGIHLSPQTLMMEDAALASLFQRAKAEKQKNVAVLNLGHRKSAMFFLRDGLPVLHRNTMVGGYQVTEAIAQKYSIGIAEAELAKIERGFLAVPGMKLTNDQEVFSSTIRLALEPVFSDFQQSLMAFSSRYQEPIDSIYICGGTALIPGMMEFLAARWQKRVAPLQVRQLFPSLSIQPQRGLEWLLPMACAIGLSQAGGEGKSTVNFRSGKLHIAGRALNLNISQFVYPAKLALTLYVVAMLSVIGQMFFLNQEIEKKDAILSRALQSVLGRVSASYVSTLRASPTKMHQTITKKIEEFQAQGKGGGSASSSLELIQELSKVIPKSTTMEIDQFDLLTSKLTLNVDSPTQQDAEKAIAALTAFPHFQSPKASALETKGTRRKFSLTTNLVKKGM
ncbi:MAG: pilus assembly protein PilM [Bacteriovoracia bacterium]